MNASRTSSIWLQQGARWMPHIGKWMLVVGIVLFLEGMDHLGPEPGRGASWFAVCAALAAGGLFCKPKWAQYLACCILLLALVVVKEEWKRGNYYWGEQRHIWQQRSLPQSQAN